MDFCLIEFFGKNWQGEDTAELKILPIASLAQITNEISLGDGARMNVYMFRGYGYIIALRSRSAKYHNLYIYNTSQPKVRPHLNLDHS